MPQPPSTPPEGSPERAAPATYPYQEGKAVSKLSYSHDAMIDMIIANPRVSNGELAAFFGYTPAWVSLVKSSDAFKERLEQRRMDLVDPVLRMSIEERMKGMVQRSLEVLQEKLSAPVNVIPDALALKALELGAKGLGLGGNAAPPPPSISPDHLNAMAQRLLDLQNRVRGVQQNEQTLDVEDAQEVPAAAREGGGNPGGV